VANCWVINASPVILLSKAEVIQFIPLLCDRLVIPAAVVGEVQNAQISDAGRNWLEAAGKKFVKPSPAIHPTLSEWHGGLGEAEVISWALHHPEFTAVLDDRRARALATRNHVAVLGSLRIIVIAKERGFISQATPALEKLRGAGAYVTSELIDRAIELAGET
jgi:predicted nucleic acid-binding protein